MKNIDVGICVEGQDAPVTKSSVGDAHTILIPPTDGSGCPGRIHTLYIDPVSGDPCPCAEPSKLQADITFGFLSESEEVPNYDTPEPSDTKTETTFDNNPTISFPLPDTCKLVGTTLDGSGPVERVTIVEVTPGPCRETPVDYSAQHTDNQLIPGMKMQLTHYLDCQSPTNVVESGANYWNSCALTGGVITAINGEYDEADHTFDVELMTGVTLTIAPTDWKPYRVDDWVTVLIVGENGETLNNKGSIDWTQHTKILIAPMYYGKYPINAGLTGGNLDFTLSDNKPIMHLRNIPATILSIDTDANTANVSTVEFGQIDGVAFAWNCPESDDFDGACQAYEVDDIVNLVIPGIAFDAHLDGPDVPPTPYIMGWQDKDELRPCNPNLLYMGDPVVCYDPEWNIQADCNADETYKYYRVFDVLKNLTDATEISIARNNALAVNAICTASTDPDKTGHGMYNCNRHNSITFDRWTVHAVAWSIIQPGGTTIWKWAIAIDYNGEHWPIPNPAYNPAVDPADDATFPHWPEDGYDEHLTCSQFEVDGFYNPNHAIDLNQLSSDISAVGWDEGDIVVSVCGNNEVIELINLTQDGDYWPSVTSLGVRIATDYVSDPDNEYRGIVLGVKGTSLYVAYAAMANNKMHWFTQVYIYDAVDDAITTLDITGHLVIYNLFTQEIWYIDHGEISSGVDAGQTFYDVDLCDNASPHVTCFTMYSRCENHAFVTYPDVNIGTGTTGFGYNNSWRLICEGEKYTGYNGGVKVIGSTSGAANAPGSIREYGIQTTYYATDCPVDVSQPVPDGAIIGGECTIYTDWIDSVGVADAVSVTSAGTGEIRTVDVKNGEECNTVIRDINLDETEEEIESGDYDEDYGNANWPHIQHYSWVRHAINRAGTEYDDIVILDNIDGEKAYGNDDEDYFFVVDTNY